MALPNAKYKIIEHYDVVSPYYYKLWGERLHHGYWIRGDESKEQAQRQLIEHLARLAKILQGAAVLGVGCGFGASSLYLCKQFDATTHRHHYLPQLQVELANTAAAKERADARFCLMDARAMTFEEPFDVPWSVESVSHYHDREKFFASAANLLKPGGLFCTHGLVQETKSLARKSGNIFSQSNRGCLFDLGRSATTRNFCVRMEWESCVARN